MPKKELFGGPKKTIETHAKKIFPDLVKFGGSYSTKSQRKAKKGY
jgi:hypothetical protein